MMSLTPESAISLKYWLMSARQDVFEMQTYTLELLLLSSCKVQKLISLLEQDCALGLGLRDIETASVDCDLGLCSLFDNTYKSAW